MKILVDMNLSPQWVSFFNQHGIEAIHWSSVGHADAHDSDIMEHATAAGLVVFTHDLDFGTLLAMRGSTGPSVIQVRTQDVLPNAIGELVLRCVSATRSYLDAGALVTVDPSSHRVRLLPI